MDSITDTLASHPNAIIAVAGDLNVHHVEWLGFSNCTDASGRAAYSFSVSCGLSQLVNFPTRPSSGQLIDLFMTTTPSAFTISELPPIGSSDHVVICATLHSYLPHKVTTFKRTILTFSKADWTSLRNYFEQADWRGCVDTNINAYCNNITSIILKGINCFIPSQSITSKTGSPPWFTSVCGKAIRERDQAYRAWKANPCTESWDFYLKLRSSARAVITKAKKDFSNNIGARISRSNLSPKEFWSLPKMLTFGSTAASFSTIKHGNQTYSHPSDIANAFCSAFVSNMMPDDPSCLVPDVSPLTAHSLATVDFNPVSVQRVLSDLDCNKATGPDKIPSVVLKECAAALCVPLCDLFRASFDSGILPSSWKCALIHPIPKKANTTLTSNFRPISILPTLVKVMETIVNHAIRSYLSNHGLISDRQYGFRPNRSTADLLSVMSTGWHNALDSHGETVLVALDLTKAFDRVWHRGLVAKLLAIGIHGSLLAWLQNYLSERRQAVVIHGKVSASSPVVSGVPQGSVLGPTLFLVFVNDLLSVTINPLHCFADDCTLHCTYFPSTGSPETRELAASSVNEDLLKIHEWGVRWRLCFNPAKTQAMFITRSHGICPQIKLNGSPIPLSETISIVGVTLSHNLKWSNHITAKAKKAASSLSLLNRLKYLLPPQCLTVLYKTMVRPHMEYCCHLFAGAPKTTLAVFDRLQRRASRLIGYTSSAIQFEPLSHRRNVASLALFYRYFMGDCSSELHLLMPAPAVFSYVTRACEAAHDSCVLVPASHTVAHAGSFIVRVSRLWNALPSEAFPSKRSLTSFKRRANKLLKDVP